MIEPRSEEELAEAIRGANGPLSVRGGNTRGMAGEGEALSVAGLTGITLYEPGALTLVARAGTPLAEIEAALAADGQALAFEPMDHRGLLGTSGEPTIGGVVASGASGPRAVQGGRCRDYVLGARFVTGEGTLVKSGGRVMKNVTGLDLARLMCGARGTLGVLTEVSLKVLPRPAASATLSLEGLDAARAVSSMANALGSPFEVTGAAWTGGRTLLRIEGLEGSVAYRAERLAERLRGFGAAAVERDAEANAATWAGVRDAAPFHGGTEDVWRVVVTPSDAPAAVEALGGEAMIDWGGGLIWVAAPKGTDLRARLTVPGFATLVRGEGAVTHPRPAAVAALEDGLRAKFDPRGVLNPGTMAA